MGIRPGALDHKCALAEHHLQQEDEEQKYADGAGTSPQGLPQHSGFIDELEQLEQPQDAAELEHPQQQLTVHLRHEERQDFRGVNQSGEAEQVTTRVLQLGQMKYEIRSKQRQANVLNQIDPGHIGLEQS